METHESARILRVAEAIADGRSIEWASETALESAENRVIESLKLVEVIAGAHRAVLEAEPSTEPLAPESPTGAADATHVRTAALITWGPLRILEPIGEGSFGEGYRAFDPSLQSEGALKLVSTID